MATIRLVTSLPRPECTRRLRETVRSGWEFWHGPMDGPRGRVGESSATLRVPIRYRNSFQTVLRLSLADNASGGTDLVCRFGMSSFVIGFMAIWFSAVVGFDVVAAASAMFSGARYQAGTFAFPLVMVAFGAGLIAVGRYFARNEQSELLAFVKRTLEARLS